MSKLEAYIDYWVPEFKWQLVDWLKKKYPTTVWDRKPKSQLLAIYHKIRKGGYYAQEKENSEEETRSEIT